MSYGRTLVCMYVPGTICVRYVHFLSSLDLSSGLEGGLTDVAIEVLHMLLSYLLQSTEEEMGVTRENVEMFVHTLRTGQSLAFTFTCMSVFG